MSPIVSLDRRFAACINGSEQVDRLWSGARWTEGPAYFPAHRTLLFSDIPNDRVMRYDELTGGCVPFKAGKGHYDNGHAVDRQGRLLACEHGTRSVTRWEADGSRTVLADRVDGHRLNSPNDLVEGPDGAIWFTDPTYGIDSDYEGFRADSEIGSSHVYRVDPATGSVRAVATDFVKPNGIAFSPDGRHLHVADTGVTHVDDGPRHIRRFAVTDTGDLTGGEVFAVCTEGVFDGFRFDRDGRLWTSAGDGVHVYDPDGTLLGKILVPEVVANLTFGGPRRNRLYITATTGLYHCVTRVIGA